MKCLLTLNLTDSDTDRDEKATVVGSSLDVSKNGGLDVIELVSYQLS